MNAAAASPPPPLLSVVVPCRNGEAHLAQLLRSVVDQELYVSAEILVVDNGSTDGSAAIARAVTGRLPVRVLEAPEPANASFARNAGAREAFGEWLCFVDADDELAPGYLAAMAAALAEHPFVTSRVDSVTLNAEWVREAHGPPWQADGIGVFFDFLPGTGVNIGVHRALYERLGGFPEELSGSQDVAFCWRAQLLGETLRFVPDAVYRYRYRDSLRGLFRQCRNWGTSNVLLYREFRAAGMPRRPWRAALRDWGEVVGGLLRARDRAARAPLVVRLGYLVGRLFGSIRHGVVYP